MLNKVNHTLHHILVNKYQLCIYFGTFIVKQLAVLDRYTHPYFLCSRWHIIGAALHKDEVCSCEVQRAICGFVAEAIQQSHLLHLRADQLVYIH